MRENENARHAPPSAVIVLGCLASVAVALHLFSNGAYGYFRDELYYLVCSDHLAWGYVDQPPLSLAVLAVVRRTLGDSIFAIRLLPALAGGATVWLTGIMARELGAGRLGQGLAGLAVLIAPLYLGLDSFFSMNCFDLLFWAVEALILIRIVKTDEPRLWILFGFVAGLGLLNKLSVMFLGAGVAAALPFTPQRRHLRTPWPWLGGGLAFAVFLPHVIWQVAHNWPTLEFMRNAKAVKITALSPLQFFLGQVIDMHPLNVPVWLAGLYFFLLDRDGRQFRLLGLTFAAIYLFLTVQTAKVGYLAPAFLALFAGGAVCLERWLGSRRGLLAAWVVVTAAGGLLTAPLAIPLLPVETFVAYTSYAMPFQPPPQERHKMGMLPQHFADRFGWENMAATVAVAYGRLSPEEQRACVVFTGNYGEAGAVNVLGRAYGLPPAVSGHNNYWLWGPDGATGAVILALGVSREGLERLFDVVEEVARVQHPLSMPYESDLPVYLAKKPRESLPALWPQVKHYD